MSTWGSEGLGSHKCSQSVATSGGVVLPMVAIQNFTLGQGLPVQFVPRLVQWEPGS